ncbi:hypothetical protein IWX75_003060 [Arthrobacter sp. CAN_A6]|uniref:hypothetical protein n=1 Tax=Arthrobacter sp. CAN_A6 TaxID=2787721 RepID=UPI0018CB3255
MEQRTAAAWAEAFSSDRLFLLEFVADPDVPLLPPFPAGASKVEGMDSALPQEPGGAVQARKLLRTYAGQERHRSDA